MVSRGCWRTHTLFKKSWGPFLERLGNLTGPKSYFEIKFWRKVECVLTSNEVHFVSLADNFTVQFSNLLKLLSRMKNKLPNRPNNYRELRETGPRARSSRCCGLALVSCIGVLFYREIYYSIQNNRKKMIGHRTRFRENCDLPPWQGSATKKKPPLFNARANDAWNYA